MNASHLPPLPQDLADSLGLGCGDSGCVTGISKGGQHTNGGCRCLRDRSARSLILLAQRLVHSLRDHQARLLKGGSS